MIRAKTLLATIVISSAAAITFVLNSTHDGYAPEPAPDESATSGSTLVTARRETPSDVIAHLPKLATPPTTPRRDVDAFQPTVVDLVDDPLDDSMAEDGNTSTTASLGDVVTADRDFASLVDQSTSDQPDIIQALEPDVPLPTRSPALKTTQRAAVKEQITLRPSKARARQTLRKHVRRKRDRKRSRAKQASVQTKKAPKKTFGVFSQKAKPVRHRAPFDPN